LIRLKKIPNNALTRKTYITFFDTVKKQNDLFGKEIVMMKFLFSLNKNNASQFNLKNSFPVISTFDVGLVKDIHSFQQKTANEGKEK
jgi:hypothetical protein